MSRLAVSAWVVVLAACMGAATVRDAHGQLWSADMAAGQIVHAPLSAGLTTSNVLGMLRYDASGDAWVYGMAAAPLGGTDLVWGGIGGGGRLFAVGSARRRAAVGIDLAAEALLFQDRVLQYGGTGGTAEAIPFVRLSSGAGHLEVRGGWRGHTLWLLGTRLDRSVFESGAQVGYGTVIHVLAESRFVHASEGTYPAVRGSIRYGGSPVQLWAEGGRWLSSELSDVTWGAGLRVPLGDRLALWATVREDAPDPLYWNTARRAWSAGVTRRLGRVPAARLAASAVEAGQVLIRVPVRGSSADSLSIAGDFNGWAPVPMRREGQDWVVRLPLGPGVYRYAFRGGSGEWFVPESVPGRRDDGMGGHVVVLMVM